MDEKSTKIENKNKIKCRTPKWFCIFLPSVKCFENNCPNTLSTFSENSLSNAAYLTKKQQKIVLYFYF